MASCADGRDVSFAETPEADARDVAAGALRRPSPLSRVQSEFFTPAASLANPPGAGGGGDDGDGLPSVSQLQVESAILPQPSTLNPTLPLPIHEW